MSSSIPLFFLVDICHDEILFSQTYHLQSPPAAPDSHWEIYGQNTLPCPAFHSPMPATSQIFITK
jgi:hypothetical protein